MIIQAGEGADTLGHLLTVHHLIWHVRHRHRSICNNSKKDVFKPLECHSTVIFHRDERIWRLTGGSDGLSWSHGVWLSHTRLLGPSCAHHAGLFLEPRAPLLLQFFLDFVDFLCQEVVIFILLTRRKRHVISCLSDPAFRISTDSNSVVHGGDVFRFDIPCCWQTRTCHPLPFAHKPPGSPFACPSRLRGQGWGIWLVH